MAGCSLGAVAARAQEELPGLPAGARGDGLERALGPGLLSPPYCPCPLPPPSTFSQGSGWVGGGGREEEVGWARPAEMRMPPLQLCGQDDQTREQQQQQHLEPAGRASVQQPEGILGCRGARLPSPLARPPWPRAASARRYFPCSCTLPPSPPTLAKPPAPRPGDWHSSEADLSLRGDQGFSSWGLLHPERQVGTAAGGQKHRLGHKGVRLQDRVSDGQGDGAGGGGLAADRPCVDGAAAAFAACEGAGRPLDSATGHGAGARALGAFPSPATGRGAEPRSAGAPPLRRSSS